MCDVVNTAFVGKMRKSDIAEACPDVSETTIERALASPLSNGKTEKDGAGRAAGYVWKGGGRGGMPGPACACRSGEGKRGGAERPRRSRGDGATRDRQDGGGGLPCCLILAKSMVEKPKTAFAQ